MREENKHKFLFKNGTIFFLVFSKMNRKAIIFHLPFHCFFFVAPTNRFSVLFQQTFQLSLMYVPNDVRSTTVLDVHETALFYGSDLYICLFHSHIHTKET